ncbi:TPA: aminoacyl-tRNA hydrolase [Candidatus Sumerlaeota bacterium]|jgi:ribosome-associated protein|nr:aminoacyl-tRNA hydrolase [Candidatus Sumerlaeota bacterium]
MVSPILTLTPSTVYYRDFAPEFAFAASRSGGPGGQNVNKVNTKVELRFHVASSALLSEHEKSVIAHKLANRINDAGELLIVSQDTRSQGQNKEEVIGKFYQLLDLALRPVKKRRPTKPSRGAKERRLAAKRNLSQKKENRRTLE